MSLLFDKQLQTTLDANGTEEIQRQDASTTQGIMEGLATGLSNAGTSLERIGRTGYGRGQMQATAAQMAAAGNLTDSDTLTDAAQTIFDAPDPVEANLPQYKEFDPQKVGAIGTILGGLAQQTPSLAVMIANPFAGATLAAAQGQTEAHAEGYKAGLRGEALENYGTVGAVTAGVGAAIPGFTGVGKGAILYGSRFLLGGAVNSVTGEADRWARAAILEDAGFTEQARQMRQADAASRVTEFALGGLFGLAGGGHRTETEAPGIREPLRGVDSVHEDAATAHLIHDHYVTESAPGLATTEVSEGAHVAALRDVEDAVANGRPVDVSAHLDDGHEFIVPRDFNETQQHVATVLRDDVEHLEGSRAILESAELQGEPVAKPSDAAGSTERAATAEATNEPDFIGIERQRADALAVTHPETAAAIHAELDVIEAEHTAATREAQAYQVAAACAINFGA